MAGGIDIKKAYAALNMPPARYAAQFVLPLVGTGVAVVVILRLFAPSLFNGIFAGLIYAIPLYFALLAAIYPYTVAEGKKNEINNNIHFFITHMGVLATANIPRGEIMRMLGEKKEYGALAEETRKIFTLVDSWNMALPEACRFISKRTPSDIWSDFLDRFAYSIESGEDLETFLRNEQLVVMEDFATVYRGALYEVENMKGLFNSMMMSVIFVVIFAILMPVITGIDGTFLMMGAVFLVMCIEIAFVYFIKAKAPNDPIWHSTKIETDLSKALKKGLPISLIATLVAVGAAFAFAGHWPPAILLAIGLTPLAYTGFIVGREEEKVKRRDDNFAAFIRSLGASTSARGGQVTETLRHLQTHDFGPLTPDIRQLYSRLNLRVDDEKAWQYFAADCGSNLIAKFSNMFVEGVKAGGKADVIGRIISENFVSIVTLRKSRYQTASNFKGLLYGLVAGMSFSLYVGVSIVGMLKRIFMEVQLPENTPFASFLNFSFDMALVGFLILILMLAHSMASGMMLHIAAGGNYFRTYFDLPLMFWVAAIVSVFAERALGRLLGGGLGG
ncbi:MAG TPA: archaellar assembly protein FlaJ [Candidatus Thermoplasmatota archaeon]|nr:archaellar assembly protein FlaJ [Candidatus Thermoplasmatota archaeon]